MYPMFCPFDTHLDPCLVILPCQQGLEYSLVWFGFMAYQPL